MNLAPIGVSTYSRVNHLKQTIDALKKNSLASESELYVFSDAPKAGDEDKVQAVREFLSTVNGFKHVEIIKRQTNSQVYNNRQGIQMLLEKYGKVIFMEEDIVTAPSFLSYMNHALDFYKDNPKIFSISGYRPPISIPGNYSYDAFFHPRFETWGFGLWKNRFDSIEMDLPDWTIKEIFLNPKNIYRFSRGGLDLLPAALNNYFGYTDKLDAKVSTQQFAMKMLTVYPVKHLVNNIGLDGSGVHKKKKNWYNAKLWQEKSEQFSFPEKMEANQEIVKSIYKFRSGHWHGFKQLVWLSMVIAKISFGFITNSIPGKRR